MRITKLSFLIAPISATLMVGAACQSAQRPATFTPPTQAQAPPIAPKPQTIPQQPVRPAAQVVDRKPEPKTDPVAELIAQAEKDYQAGQDNYKAGHLGAAKQNFDRALNLLEGSKLDIHSDKRLQREYDRVLEGVNRERAQASREADASTEQKAEPAPIDEANEVTYPVDPKIKAKAEAEV